MTNIKNYNIQLLRAFAIIAVVCIHTCPSGLHQVLFRPYINFAVALFVFISGYLTKIENDNWLFFYKKRIIRVIIPFIIWTGIYSLYDVIVTNAAISLFSKHLLLASARAHLYYIPVYIGLVIIAPFMRFLIKSKYRFLAWTLAPLSLIVFFYTRFIPKFQLDPLIIKISGLLFFNWFSYYFLGIIMGNNIRKKGYNNKILYFLLFMSVILQTIEAYVLYTKFDFTNCGTQGKISSLTTNMIFLLIVGSYLSVNKNWLNCSLLKRIGDYSFGIYLCHVLFINILELFSFYHKIPYPINSILVLSLSFVFCYVFDQILSPRISKYIGIK